MIQTMLFSGLLGFVLLVAYLHILTGLAFEFHLFFIFPVLLASWLLGARAGLAMAFLAVGIWIAADYLLVEEFGDSLPWFFNGLVRLAIFSFGASLVGGLRHVLQRESRLARQDALTGLPNRREFYDLGRRAAAQAQRQDAPLTAVFIDLDHFKEVNDQYGHETGDHLLASVAEVMRQQVRATDIAGRLGGDEFALLLPNMGAAAAASYVENLRQRLLAEMRQQDWPVTFSIGVASYEVAPRDFEDLLAKADALMYEVKDSGRDRISQKIYPGEPT
jgi:diguanylate cyclase (GGDEF)-like protein